MQQKKNGLNDSDKIFITVALWISAIALFAAVLTLPMLPDKVLIFYHPTENTDAESYSKWNNLFLIITSVIPALIILVTAVLKKRNRLQNNFASIMLFSIVLSLCMSSIIIYGITRQFDSSNNVQLINWHALVSIILSFFMSMLFAVLPTAINTSERPIENASTLRLSLRYILCEYWNVGAYGFLLGGIACAFTPGAYSYIPLVVCVIAQVVFLCLFSRKRANTAADE